MDHVDPGGLAGRVHGRGLRGSPRHRLGMLDVGFGSLGAADDGERADDRQLAWAAAACFMIRPSRSSGRERHGSGRRFFSNLLVITLENYSTGRSVSAPATLRKAGCQRRGPSDRTPGRRVCPQILEMTMKANVPSTTYVVDTCHTRVVFSVNHFGFNDYCGQFSGVSGTLQLDPDIRQPAFLT
jgi:hypothetical protein